MAERITPQDFATGAPPRIMGTEAEDHVSSTEYQYSDNVNRLSEDARAINRLLSRQTFEQAGIAMHSMYINHESYIRWLSNGQKMHLDCREMLECCSPESLGPKEAFAATLAGIKVEKELAKVSTDASRLPIKIFRRSATVNAQGNVRTSAFHMNHITPEKDDASLDRKYENPALYAHAVTRLYTWGGMVAPDGYSLSQKGLDTEFFYKYKETEFGYTRIEDYSGEQSSHWGTFMALATTSVLLRVQEHPKERDLNKRFNALSLNDPHTAILTVARDETLKETLPLADGRRLTAIEIQTELADIASEVGRRFTLPKDEQYAVDQWQKVCKDLKEAEQTGDIKPLSTRIGWVSKKLWLEKKNVGPLQADNPEAVLFDMDWDCIYPKEGGRMQYPKRTGLTIVTDEEIIALVNNPPQETRAKLRGKAIKEQANLRTVNWSGYKSNDGIEIVLDPYQTSF